MSGDPTPRRDRRSMPPDPAAATELAVPGADPAATDPDPNATEPDPPAAPDGPAPADTAPDVPDERGTGDPEDVRVAPLHAPPARRRRSGGTAELPDPEAPSAPPARTAGGSVRGVAFALGTGVLVVAVALLAVFALGDDGEPDAAPAETRAATPRAAAPEGTSGGAAPAPTTVPPSAGTSPPPAGASGGPVAGAEPPPGGDGVTFQVVEDGPGYYEGSFVVTNRTGRPLASWRLTFLAPGSDVRNVWGGRLVRGGERAVIENAPGAAAVPPMGTVTVRFGAAGEPVPPAECVLNGAGCGL